MNILLVGMGFFTYEDEIQKELKRKGHNVYYMTDTRKMNFLIKEFLSESAIAKLNYSYQKKYVDSIREPIDIVLVLVGRKLGDTFFEAINNNNDKAKVVLYLWDDIARVENYENNRKYYSDIVTFDLVDSINYKLRFVPLFHVDAFRQLSLEKKHEIITVSANHTDRLRIINKVVEQIDNGCFYIVGRRSFVTNIFKVRKMKKKGIIYKFNSVGLEDVNNMMNQSIAVLDIQQPTQKGLTMRTIETIATGNKLITTNEQAKYYDFYNNNNVLIIDRADCSIDKNFLKKKFDQYPKALVDKYSLGNWIDNVLFDKRDTYLK